MPGWVSFTPTIPTKAGQISTGVDIETPHHASRVISDWIDFYNRRRPHQALGMKTPAEAFALAA